jgi:hypothetical protein
LNLMPYSMGPGKALAWQAGMHTREEDQKRAECTPPHAEDTIFI